MVCENIKEKRVSIVLENVKDLEQLEPYGEANKCPIFLYKNLKEEVTASLQAGASAYVVKDIPTEFLMSVII